jgi:hypothetical protein
MTDIKLDARGVDRREAIRRVGALLGGVAFVGGTGLLEACAKERGTADSVATAPRGPQPIGQFSVADQAFLDEVADTILPTTAASPGAKAAATGPFMALMVTDCYDAKDQQIFREGIRALDAACEKQHGTGFMKATAEQRTAVLTALDQEAATVMKTKPADAPTPYFRMMKELTLLGFFTSEIGCTQALRYKESPGPFEACVPYTKGDRAWAGHA